MRPAASDSTRSSFTMITEPQVHNPPGPRGTWEREAPADYEAPAPQVFRHLRTYKHIDHLTLPVPAPPVSPRIFHHEVRKVMKGRRVEEMTLHSCLRHE